nr:MAG TPA: tail tape measure protein [Caudoviricetes sp.]
MIDLTAVIDNEEAIRKFRELRNIARNATTSVVTDADRMDYAMQRFAATLGKIGVGVSLAGLVRQIATTRGEFQQLEVAFTTLLQNKEKADALMAEMVDLAAKTPFDLKGVADGARQLLAYGFAAEDITGTLTRLGNVAAGLGLPLERLTYLYGTTAVQGRLYARDMLQFTSSGIPVLQEMAKMYGKTTEEINEMVSAGKIGFEDVKKVIEGMTNEGGQFYNLMQEQSKTITGLISNLGDALDTMFNDIGKSQEGVIAGVLQGTISLVENYQKVLDILVPLVATYGTYRAALIATAAIEKVQATITATKAILEQTKMLTRATQAQILFNKAVKANPYVLAASALVGLVSVIWRFSNRAKEAAKNAEGLARVNRQVAEQTDAEVARIKSLQDILSDTNAAYSARKKALDDLKSIVPSYHANLTEEGSLINNNTAALKAYITEFERLVKLQAAQDELTEAYKKQRQLQKELTKYEHDLAEARQYNSLVAQPSVSAKVGTSGLQAISMGAGSGVAKPTAEIENQIERIKSEISATNDIINELNNEITNTSFEEEASKTILSAIQNLTDAQNAYNEAVKAWEAAVSDGSDISVVKEKQGAVDAAKKALDEARKLAGVDEKTKKAVTKSQKELADLVLANDLALEQSRLDIMKDGREKELAELDMQITEKLQVIEKERKLLNEAYDKDPSSARNEAAQRMTSEFKGNAGLLARPLIDAAELVKKGWEDAGDGIATVFSSQYGILDAEGKEIELLVTPILPNGDVLSPQELEDYIYRQLQGASDILKSDTKKIVIATGVSSDGSAGEILHQLQEAYYSEDIKFKERQINIEQKLVDAKAAINLKYANEYDKISKQIMDDTLSDEERKFQDIKDKYAEFRKWVETAKEGGSITLDQAGELEGKIKQAEENKVLLEKEKAWNEYLTKYGTFRERLQATKDEYDRKIAGTVTEGERSMLEAERDAALADFEVQASEWAQQLADMSIVQLDEMMREAQKKLEEARKAYDKLDSSSTSEAEGLRKTIIRLEAEIKKLKEQLSKASETAKTGDWGGMATAFNAIAETTRNAANGIREYDEGLANVLSTMGDIAASVGSFASAMGNIETSGASFENVMGGITSGISLATTVIGGLFNLFKRDDAIERTRRQFADLNDEIIRLKRESEINGWEGTIFGEDAFRNASENMNVFTEAYDRYNKTLSKIQKRGGKFSFLTGIKEWESAAESIANMSVKTRHGTWFRSAKYESLGSLLPELFDDGELNMDALQKFTESDLFGKLAEENQELIKDLVDDWELYQDAIEATKDYLSGIFGDLGNTMTDALADAFTNGTNAAESFKDSVSGMLGKLAKDMIYSIQLAPLFEEAQKQMLTAMENASGLSPEKQFEQYTNIIDSLVSSVEGKQDDVMRMLEAFREAGNKHNLDLFTPDNDVSAQTASTRGYQVMSQDEGEEMNGRLSDVQAKTGNILAAVEFVKSLSAEQLNRTTDIRDIMIQLNGNVADIRSYTRVLPTMNETLTSMNRKLDNL